MPFTAAAAIWGIRSTSTMSKWLTEAFCLLQYDYATPYTDPGPADTLPDFQTCYFVLLAALILVWLGWQTHCTVRAFAAETARLNSAVDAIAAGSWSKLTRMACASVNLPATLQALQTMGRELTDSLQSQWRMEQQRTEQIAALAHDLKTPLTVIQGNAELLEEDTLSDAQHAQLQAILRGHRARTPLFGRSAHSRRSTCRTNIAGQPHPHGTAGADSPRSLRACRNPFYITGGMAGGDPCCRKRPAACCGKPFGQRRRPHTARRNRHPDRCKGKQQLYFACDRYRPRLHARSAGKSRGNALHRRRPAADASHQGLGLYFAKKVAQFHGGTLVLSNLSGTHGACAELRLPIGR